MANAATRRRSAGSEVTALQERSRRAQLRRQAAKKNAKEARKLLKEARRIAKRAKAELQVLGKKLKRLLAEAGRDAGKRSAKHPARRRRAAKSAGKRVIAKSESGQSTAAKRSEVKRRGEPAKPVNKAGGEVQADMPALDA